MLPAGCILFTQTHRKIASAPSMDISPLQVRLNEDARRYDPTEHHRSLLGPFREAIFLWRVKFMSYEQIAATLTRHGIKVSPAGVGVYCRRNFTKAELLRERERLAAEPQRKPDSGQPASATARPNAPVVPGKRGPKIARDDY